MRLNRRDLIAKCAAMGVVTFAGKFTTAEASAAWDGAEKLRPTTPSELGPFYRANAPQNPMLRHDGDRGLPLDVAGTVYDVSGQKLTHATVEIWQANHDGIYDVEGPRFRAKLLSDPKGEYAFSSVMPGHYPARVCQHVHYLVRAEGCKPLVTQLYFATDPVFDGDPDKNFAKDPLIWSRDVVRPVQLKGDPKAISAAVRFDVVLERL